MNPSAVPLINERSVTLKPVTDSLNVMVKGMGDTLVVLKAVEVMLTVGATLSNVRFSWLDATLPSWATSSTEALGSEIDTVPCAKGCIGNTEIGQ